MQERENTFETLEQELLERLKDRGCSQATITGYRYLCNSIISWLQDNGYVYYTEEGGNAFLKEYLGKHGNNQYYNNLRTAIYRLNDLTIGSWKNVHSDKGKNFFLSGEFVDIVNRYCLHEESKGLTAGTIKYKRYAISWFLHELEKRQCCSLLQITPEVVVMSCTPITYHSLWGEVKLFLRYLVDEGKIDVDYSTLVPHYSRPYVIPSIYSIPSTIASKETYVPYLYTDQDIEDIFREADLFSAPHAVKNNYIAYEMSLLLRLLLCCGLRVGETLNIKVGDIDFDRKLFILRVTKKHKQRLVPFGNELSDMPFRYCTAMGVINDSEAYLFPEDNKYTPLKANSVGNFYRIIRKRAGIYNKQRNKNDRGACLHCFRHTFAVRSFDKNERRGIGAKDSVPFISTYLGHDSLYETEKYLKYSGDYFADTLTKFDAFTGDLFPEVDMDE